MALIGIIVNEKEENYLDKKIEKELNLGEGNVLYIKEKSIENIKNISFNTIILGKKFKNTELLKKILEKANYVIVNSDIEDNLKLLENIKATILTYGFNSKATITTSSIQDEKIMICIQRAFKNAKEKKIEPQEIETEIIKNVECTMAIKSCLLLYEK